MKQGKGQSQKNTGRQEAGRRHAENLTRRGKGRPRGVPNKVTTEAKAACNAIVDDPVYRKNLATRMRSGTVHSSVETMVWYYAKGKPKERVEIGADKSLAGLITEAVTGLISEPADEPMDDDA